MRIFLKHMNPALWCCFTSNIVVFLFFLTSYFCSNADAKIQVILITSLAMQGIMFCTGWGMIVWSMHDREKRETEHEKFMQEIKRDHANFINRMKAPNAERLK